MIAPFPDHCLIVPFYNFRQLILFYVTFATFQSSLTKDETKFKKYCSPIISARQGSSPSLPISYPNNILQPFLKIVIF